MPELCRNAGPLLTDEVDDSANMTEALLRLAKWVLEVLKVETSLESRLASGGVQSSVTYDSRPATLSMRHTGASINCNAGAASKLLDCRLWRDLRRVGSFRRKLSSDRLSLVGTAPSEAGEISLDLALCVAFPG